MKQNRILALLMSCAVLGALATATRGLAAEGEKKNPQVVETKAAKTRGEAPKLTTSLVNDPNAKVAPPANKGGAKTRAGLGWCTVAIFNWTPWRIQIFVDDDFKGLVSSFGDGTVDALTGKTKIYGRAEFTDGSYLSWGPQIFDCESYTTHTWKLEN